ncbi:MAG: carbon starvation protein A [Deltaproteobacteria bacterium]|nr:carbon starvation protein A [Deltaproteobacteria bacterium]
MLIFLSSVLLLIAGYLTYGLFVEKVFGIDRSRPTPAIELADGVDYVSMPAWKTYLIQLLDIAGIGPIFGPIMGALYGPEALLWIVVGSIFAGGVHDFFSGMLSVRNGGENLPTIMGHTLGRHMRSIMLVFALLLLVLVGVVFVLSPAKMLENLTQVNVGYYVAAIFIYYFVATIVPIDKIIGRFYPFLGGLLLFMTFGIFFGMVFGGHKLLPHLNFVQVHPDELPMWPLLFITLSCGAISGFHSTQSPLMSRCISNEKYGRFVFYGAMISEGIIALLWATVGLSLYEPAVLHGLIEQGTAAFVVDETSRNLLGAAGGFLAVLGVIVLPITSGDTAFRSARLIISEAAHLPQKSIGRRLLIAVPLFVIGFIVSQVQFDVIWRYMGWSNQTLATLVLWSAAFYLAKNSKFHWIATVPAVFLTGVVVTFICYAQIGLRLPYQTSVIIGVTVATLSFIGFFAYSLKNVRFADQNPLSLLSKSTFKD